VNRNSWLCFASAVGFAGVINSKQWLTDVIGVAGIVILDPKLSDYTYKGFKLSYPGGSQRRAIFYPYYRRNYVLGVMVQCKMQSEKCKIS